MPTGSRQVLAAQGAAAVLPRLGAGGGTVSVKTEVPVDHATVGLQTDPAVGGVMSTTLPAVDIGYCMRIERIGISTTSAQPTICTVYVGDADPQNQADYSPVGDQDQADENSPILVPGGQPLTLVWTGASAGAIGYARVQFTTAVIVKGQVASGSGAPG